MSLIQPDRPRRCDGSSGGGTINLDCLWRQHTIAPWGLPAVDSEVDSDSVTEFHDPLMLRARARVDRVLREKWRLDVLLGESRREVDPGSSVWEMSQFGECGERWRFVLAGAAFAGRNVASSAGRTRLRRRTRARECMRSGAPAGLRDDQGDVDEPASERRMTIEARFALAHRCVG